MMASAAEDKAAKRGASKPSAKGTKAVLAAGASMLEQVEFSSGCFLSVAGPTSVNTSASLAPMPTPYQGNTDLVPPSHVQAVETDIEWYGNSRKYRRVDLKPADVARGTHCKLISQEVFVLEQLIPHLQLYVLTHEYCTCFRDSGPLESCLP